MSIDRWIVEAIDMTLLHIASLLRRADDLFSDTVGVLPRWHHRLDTALHPHEVRQTDRPHLVRRRPGETSALWRARWIRGAEVADFQRQLNAFGADLIVDGAFGPATAAAERTCALLHRRDRLEPAWLASVVGDVAITDRKVST